VCVCVCVCCDKINDYQQTIGIMACLKFNLPIINMLNRPLHKSPIE